MRRRIAWWNVQRLFAPRSSRLSRALDATPSQGWTRAAYNAKLERIAAVLRHACEDTPPLILALAEVENADVAADLRTRLGWDELEIAEDPSARVAGSDLVVLHDRQLKLAAPPVLHTVHNRFDTGDIFELEFATRDRRRFVLYTNHWPSRVVSNSVALRIATADYLRRLVEARLKFGKGELVDVRGRPRLPPTRDLTARAETPILIVGDLNDSPYDSSVADVLSASRSRAQVTAALRLPTSRGMSAVEAYLRRHFRLYNPSWSRLLEAGTPSGTAHFGGDWYLLDQVILSRGTLMGEGPRYVEDSLAIHAPRAVQTASGETVEFCTAAGVPKPFDARTRTGVADHLPVTFDVEL